MRCGSSKLVGLSVIWFFGYLVYWLFTLTIDKIFMGLCFPTVMLVSLRDHRSRLQRKNCVQIIDIFRMYNSVEDLFVVGYDEYSLSLFLFFLQDGKHADYAFEI